MFRACLFPLPRFLPPIVLFNRITTLIVKQSLSSLVLSHSPKNLVVGIVDYQCRNIRRKTLVQDIHGPFLHSVSSLSERPQLALTSL